MNKAVEFLFAISLCWAGAGSARSLSLYEIPRAAPQFELPSIADSTMRLSDFKGRYLLVNFWAVWCAPCRKEMPSMQRAYEILRGERFDMLAIHVGPSVAGAEEFASQLELTFPIAVDIDMALGQWQVQGLPTTFLVDPDGQIVAEAVGEREWDSEAILEQIRSLIGQP